MFKVFPRDDKRWVATTAAIVKQLEVCGFAYIEPGLFSAGWVKVSEC
jgi:hypothetical protein